MPEGKILLVAGASSDVGGALIRRVATEFDTILCHYGRSAVKIEQLQQEFGDRIVPLQADLSSPEEARRMAAEIAALERLPTHFVYLPAIPNVNRRYAKTDWAEFDAQLTVQVRGAYELCKVLLPVMAKQKFGRVVFMLTENVARSVPGKYAVPYTTAKYALFGLLKCLSAEYADKGITVNGLSPSMIDTEFVAGLPELARQLNAENSPMKRNLSVDDVTPTIAFLLSDGAGMITGQNFSIMGGN
jgi:3-oxoacyl-[acyl-carrier protein] reductase